MKKSIFIILIGVVIIIIGVVIVKHLNNSKHYLETYESPDGKYQLVVKKERSLFFNSTMPGNGGKSMPVEVILKNATGKIIGRSSSNSDCGILWFSVEVRWDLKNDQVWYARAKTINLKTGKVEC